LLHWCAAFHRKQRNANHIHCKLMSWQSREFPEIAVEEDSLMLD
jgi:hypothetical protein